MGRITRNSTTRTTKPKRHVVAFVAKATTLIIRILPTAIFVTALTGSIIIGYLAQINIPSSLSSSSSSASVKRIPRLRIGAYYPNWDNHQEETKFHEPTLLGGLNDGNSMGSKTNSTVVAAAWAKHSQKFQQQAGIDFFIMSWGSTQEQHELIKQYMQHPKTIRIALNIESLALYYKSRVSNLTETQQQQQPLPPAVDKQNYSKSKDDNTVIDFQQPCINAYPKQNQMVTTFGEIFISYIIKVMKDIVVRYRNKYLFVGDRPVFVLGHTYQFINHEAYIDRIRRFFKTRFGVQPYFVADMVRGKDVDNHHDILKRTKISGRNKFDSITGYNRLDFDGLLQKDESKLNENLLRTETEYLRFSNPFRSWWDFLFVDDDTTTERTPVVPYVHVPGYYDDDHNAHFQQQQDQSQIYDKFWDLAERLLDRNPCLIKSDEWFVFLGVPFNEPYESNHYLQITKERGRSLYPACV